MSMILKANEISVRTSTATLLDRVSVEIHHGESVAIIGPNGAGKSTLLRALSGDIKTAAGEVRLDGVNVAAMPPENLALRRFMLSQHVTISFPFTVLEVIRMGAHNVPRATADQFVQAAIEEVGLTELCHRELPTLSGGEQQRAHFARVLVQAACGKRAGGDGVLMLDEPTSSLDMKHQIGLIEIARRRAAQGMAVVAVLHDMNLACMFADRIIVLKSGKLVADGKPQDIIASAMLRNVFHVDVCVNQTAAGVPYILPQEMRTMPL